MRLFQMVFGLIYLASGEKKKQLTADFTGLVHLIPLVVSSRQFLEKMQKNV